MDLYHLVRAMEKKYAGDGSIQYKSHQRVYRTESVSSLFARFRLRTEYYVDVLRFCRFMVLQYSRLLARGIHTTANRATPYTCDLKPMREVPLVWIVSKVRAFSFQSGHYEPAVQILHKLLAASTI
jgi:hypothetical protein